MTTITRCFRNLASRASNFFDGATHKRLRSQSRCLQSGGSVEALEDRRMMTAQAVVDFDGDWISAAELQEGGWNNLGDTSVSSFNSLFSSDRPHLDLNGDGAVNNTDANLAIGQIMDKVRKDYSPYDLSIIVGDQDAYQGILTDNQPGDVMVMVTGGTDVRPGKSANGVAPWADLGNERDELVWVFGEDTADYQASADKFVNAIARTISHEMGHAFGLGHIDAGPVGDTQTHHLMNVIDRDYDHDFAFQDIDYVTVTSGYLASAEYPELNTTTQNAHQYLSHPGVLGSSSDPWFAVLKPGELTIAGSDNRDSISIKPAGKSAWDVTVSTAHQSFVKSSYRLPSYTYYVTTTTRVDHYAHGTSTLNPYREPLSRLNILAGAGNDYISIASTITAGTVVYGGAGDDTISTGAGNDYIYGEAGNDTLLAGSGNDYLYGGSGADTVDGQAGNDRLWGDSYFSDDNVVDYLFGGSGSDTFNQRYSYFWWRPLASDVISDPIVATVSYSYFR